MSDGTPPKDGLNAANRDAIIAYERAHPMQPGETVQQALSRHSQGGADQTNSKVNAARTAAAQARIRGANTANPASPRPKHTTGDVTRKGRTL